VVEDGEEEGGVVAEDQMIRTIPRLLIRASDMERVVRVGGLDFGVVRQGEQRLDMRRVGWAVRGSRRCRREEVGGLVVGIVALRDQAEAVLVRALLLDIRAQASDQLHGDNGNSIMKS